jgi:inner membrane protein
MDNLTHSLVGLAAAKAGLEKLSPGATVLSVLAANAPDADIIVLLFGDRWTFLQHHRGITHAIVGTVVLSFLLPLLFYLGDWIRTFLTGGRRIVSLKGLIIASLIVSATHPLLDWTNNYGIRFFLPWNSSWSYGDLVFIVDPYIWLVFGSAVFLVTSGTTLKKVLWVLVGLVTTFLVVAAARRNDLEHSWVIWTIWLLGLSFTILLWLRGSTHRWGRKIPIAAFSFLVLYWSALAIAHGIAVGEGNLRAATVANLNGETVLRLAAMPTAANPFSWDCVFETDRAMYRFPLAIVGDSPIRNLVRYDKTELNRLADKLAANRSSNVFLGFARFPVAQLKDPNCTARTFVQLADLRYTEPGRSRGSFALEMPIECPNAVSTSR